MDKIKFSVSMCVYGKDNPIWFKAAVDSILEQSLKPDEVVLVVDGPVPEDLGFIINTYQKLPIFKVIRFEENRGHGCARRAGLSACENDLVAIMDSDDVSVFDRFEKQISYFKSHPQTDIVGGIITEFIESIDNPVGKRVVPADNASIYEYMKTRCPMNLVTVMFKKSSVESVGGFIDWYCEEDYYLWVRMAQANMNFANIDETLVNVRVGKDMYNRRGGWKYFKSELRLQMYMRKHKIIGFFTYVSNVLKRFILQVLMPNKVRGWVFKKIARKSVK